MKHLTKTLCELDLGVKVEHVEEGEVARRVEQSSRRVAPNREGIEGRIRVLRSRQEALALTVTAQLPLWDDSLRGVPNVILRTALFRAMGKGRRRLMNRELVGAMQGLEMSYTGESLDQSDLDVWAGALHLARQQLLGGRIEFSEKSFLKMIDRGGEAGHSIGKSDRVWLRRTLARLSATNLQVSCGALDYNGSLVEEYSRDRSNGRYVLVLNRRLVQLFGADSWTKVDWGIRRALRGHPLAQWLHGFFSTHAKTFPLGVELLHKLSGSMTGAYARTDAAFSKALHGWRYGTLVPALNALKVAFQAAGQTFDWAWKGELVEIHREPTMAQARHLRRKAGNR